MALVRVYCGLASADAGGEAPGPGPSLTAAIVDDSGRLLDLSDLADDPAGYSQLSLLLAERGAGPYSVAVAADRDDRLVPNLLVTAGWALAFTDEAAADDFAQRYTDDLTDEAAKEPHQRRAVGLARALHAGALSAALLPTPTGLTAIKPLLTAHGALATGRHAAATALREVLRELYPAALRAYADPCDPVALAVLEAVPEPGRLAVGTRNRNAVTPQELTAELTRNGVADEATVSEAVRALRVALAEMPRPGTLSRAFTAPAAEAVRHAVAAVRACDAAGAALIGALSERVTRAPVTDEASESSSVATSEPAAGESADSAAPTAGRRRSRSAGHSDPASISASRRGRSRTGSALDAFTSSDLPRRPARMPDPRPPAPEPTTPPPVAPEPVSPPPTAPEPVATHAADGASPVSSAPPARGRPVSAPPPPPPGIAPIAEPRPPRQVRRRPEPAASASHESADTHRTPQGPPPGSRSNWPTTPADDDWAADPLTSTSDRVVPPWRADDLQPPEAPSLRLVEPTLPEELRDDLANGWQDSSALRTEHAGLPHSVPPVAASAEDDDLLIFAQTRSAWFSAQGEGVSWSSRMDAGWQAAEQAANPDISERTEAGLPRRVPHANLVPGSPPRTNDRPLRIVRNPSEIAKHTSGYFNGWRRGQQVGGFPLGGRVGRQSVGAWDFSRDDDRDYGT